LDLWRVIHNKRSQITHIITKRPLTAIITMLEEEPQFRMEHDLIGDEEVPNQAYYGIQTLRAMQNFDITGVPISHFPQLIRSLAMVKKAAALANCELGHLERKKAKAIVAACDEIINEHKLHDQFPVDLIQGGAGTYRQ